MTKKEIIKQKIIATLVIFFMFLMIFGSMRIHNVNATGSNTVVELVLGSGSLSLESPNQVNFNTINISGGTFNIVTNLTQVNMRDPRGTGEGWSAVGSANNMTTANASTIGNEYLRWSPGTIYALDGSSNTGVTAGAAYSGNFADGLKALVTATSGNGLGNYVINGTVLNLTILPDFVTGTYQNTLLLTIS